MAFPADLMRIMDQFGHCASPYRASFQIVLEIDICNFFLRRIWYELELSLITLRTNLSWFLSLFSLTQGESRNCRSRRRSNTSATGKQIFFPFLMFPIHLWSWCPWFHLHDRKRSGWAIQRLASQNQRIPSWGVKGISPENQVSKYKSWFTTWTLAVVEFHFHPTLMNPFLPFLSWYQPILT